MDRHGNNADVSAPIALIGAGTIGIGWALVFATGGRRVNVYDHDAEMLRRFPGALATRLAQLDAGGLLTEHPDHILKRATTHSTLEAAVKNAAYVQENASESLDLKRELFAELDRLSPPSAVLASSTSTIPSSRFTDHLSGRHRCLVVHPANPPYLLRVAEVVPSEHTSKETVALTVSTLSSVSMRHILVNLEPEGFVFNRLQGALLREAYFLVGDGVIAARDIDLIVREGLGKRWLITGPFATSELNTRGGVAKHAELIAPVYARIGRERGTADPWVPSTVARVVEEMNEALPAAEWEQNVLRREQGLIALEAMRRRGELPTVPAES